MAFEHTLCANCGHPDWIHAGYCHGDPNGDDDEYCPCKSFTPSDVLQKARDLAREE